MSEKTINAFNPFNPFIKLEMEMDTDTFQVNEINQVNIVKPIKTVITFYKKNNLKSKNKDKIDTV
jgi:hypothetical protein